MGRSKKFTHSSPPTSGYGLGAISYSNELLIPPGQARLSWGVAGAWPGLPILGEPVVCLLPQKPGVLHAYWILPPGTGDERVEYKLRLCHAEGEAINVSEEVPVQGHRGNWYFHVAEAANTAAMLVQLGYYREGRFVSARGRSVARLPSLYASTRTDERWWVSEADFMRMYLRAGGFVTASRRFGWNASIGSPGQAPATPQESLAWPGGISSSFE